MADLTSVDFVKRQSSKLSSSEQAAEYWNCRRNPFYFIFNYSYIPEIGGILKYEESMMHDKMKQLIKAVYNYNRAILMATRQLGKALYIKTKIPTPKGIKKLEELHINDYVFDEFGRPTKIIAETPIQLNRPCYMVQFDNGINIVADEQHLWKITIPEFDPDHERLFNTKNIFDMMSQGLTTFIIGRGYQNIKIINIKKCKSVPVKCIQVNNKTGMFLISEKKIPTHNSTIAANILEWASNFYPNFPSTILNMTKKAAFENLDKIKAIHAALPDFLRTPLKFKGERKTTLDYTNGSIVRIFYPSSTTQPSTLARSFTSPGLYIDEAAFINHIDIAYTAAQPTLSRAREQARKHSYPWFILISSTPNGSVGTGQWFYEMYNNATPSEDIFDENNNLREHADEIMKNPKTNGFVKIRYHWSEDPTKDDNWYQEQCRDLNHNSRSINQELDLVFVGSTSCIFDDDFLSQLKIKAPIDRIDLPHVTDCKLYTKRENLDKTDFLLIGIDTAKSITGDYSAIEIYTYSNFEQIGEFYGRLGSITKYCEIIKKLVDILEITMHNRLILCIENNSIGAAVIESLENDENSKYSQYIYSPNPQKYIGINTNSKIKNTMVSFFYDDITKDPSLLKSEPLINQLNLIERHSNGSISAKSGSHDDLFMASCLCAYTRHLSSLEYEPLIGVTSHIQQQQSLSKIRTAINLNKTVSVKNNSGIQISYNQEEHGIEYLVSDYEYENNSSEDDYVSIF